MAVASWNIWLLGVRHCDLFLLRQLTGQSALVGACLVARPLYIHIKRPAVGICGGLLDLQLHCNNRESKQCWNHASLIICYEKMNAPEAGLTLSPGKPQNKRQSMQLPSPTALFEFMKSSMHPPFMVTPARSQPPPVHRHYL